jgi:hypothetical protein
MRKSIIIITALTFAGTAAIISCSSGSASENENTQPTQELRVKRGEYLVSVIGCDDCHSPKKMGQHEPEIIPELRLSGFNRNVQLPKVDPSQVTAGWMMFAPDLTSAVGPWGQSFAANLTSDETGIGNWSEENFIRALREGKYKGIATNRNLLPPMPWFVYKNMTDEDLKSIFAYLKTVPPVENIVPAPVPFSELNQTGSN